ncbi:hypothetical protein IDJ77_21020 [Mucilaginibacter sp. ZT4R22]|uniref:Uncharacterized protein n=1 Tax=Mucilaginibacter pankratovii TaxID=2772110 RepID=A0ABR7WVI7_9SPHI|nr:hypothetical protein [Mucilaginibacter pankratovii]MBD1366308.1 hypothetical protein [Mucilaginibacter pankratovii]
MNANLIKKVDKVLEKLGEVIKVERALKVRKVEAVIGCATQSKSGFANAYCLRPYPFLTHKVFNFYKFFNLSNLFNISQPFST